MFDELWGYSSERARRLYDELVPVPTRRISCRLTVTHAGFEGEGELLQELYKRGMALPVSAPFHCPLMQPAADAMAEALDKTAPGPLRLPLFANVTAAIVSDPAEVRRLLVEQVTGRVRWRESAIARKNAGVEHFVELGGKVLGPMISRSVEDVKVASVVTIADIEALAKEL